MRIEFDSRFPDAYAEYFGLWHLVRGWWTTPDNVVWGVQNEAAAHAQLDFLQRHHKASKDVGDWCVRSMKEWYKKVSDE